MQSCFHGQAARLARFVLLFSYKDGSNLRCHNGVLLRYPLSISSHQKDYFVGTEHTAGTNISHHALHRRYVPGFDNSSFIATVWG